MRILSAEENAREEGRESAVAWASLRGSSEEITYEKWREQRRARLIEQYDDESSSSLCSSDLPREDFLDLLEEWDQGFYRAVNVILGSPEERAAEIKRIAVQASAMCSLLGMTNLIPEERRLSTLQTCAHIVDEIAGDLAVLVGEPQ
jgi:hypothetical protein